MKVALVVSGDHHSGPGYDRCLLAENDIDVDALLLEFQQEYPIHCSKHSPNNDYDHGCLQCWARKELSELKATAAGLLVDGGGFWHMTFADWLAKEKGLLPVSFNTYRVG